MNPKYLPSCLNRLSLLALVALAAGCSRPNPDVVVRLPGRLAALTPEERAGVEVTLEIPGLLAETPLQADEGLTEASGTFVLAASTAGTHPFTLRVRWAPDDDTSVALAEQQGSVTIVAGQDNALDARSDWDVCGAAEPGAPCALRYDLNRNGTPNLDDLVEGIDPTPPPPFIDVSPDDLAFPSGIRLGSFARQVIVVENTSARPIAATVRLIDAPGATLQLFEQESASVTAAPRELDLGVLDPFEEILVAVSFAPANPFLTVGDVFVDAIDPQTRVRQAARVRLLANVDGALQPPFADFVPPAPVVIGDLPVEIYSAASLFNGLPVTATQGTQAGVPGLVQTGRTLTASFAADPAGTTRTIPADHAFLVGVPPEHKLAVTLAGLETDIDLAVFLLDDSGAIAADPTRNFTGTNAGTSAEALELVNESGTDQRALVVLGRVELAPPPAVAGALSEDAPAPFALSAHVTSTPEFTAPAAVVGQDAGGARSLLPPIGPLEGGARVELRGRRFSPLARVTFGDVRATDCTFREEPPETIFECSAPAGSLLVGKNPATIVVANPEQDEGGDGQAASLPDGFTYEPPAPRLDAILPSAAPSTGSTIPLTLSGAFFSTRNGPPRVFFGAVEADAVEFVDSARLRVFAPPQAPGIVVVYAQNRLEPLPDAPATERLSLPSNVRSFTYTATPFASPAVTAVQPATGAVDGGDIVTVTGTGFRPGAAVLFDDVAVEARQVDVRNETEIVCPSPPRAAPGLVDITVINDDGKASTLAAGFDYFVPQPTVTAPFPATGSIDGGTIIVLPGSGFRAGVRVDFVRDGAPHPALNVNRVNATTLLVSTPAVPDGGAYTVRVTNLDGQRAELVDGFRFIEPAGPPPRVDGITPNAGDREQQQVATISGANFRSPTVLVGSQPATVQGGDAATITVILPTSSAEGPAVVRVINDDGQSDTIVFTYFTVRGNAPVIQSITPPSAARGDTIEINGAYFEIVTDANGARGLHPEARLFVGGQLIVPTVVADGQLRVRVPDLDAALVANGGGAVAVEIVNSDGQSTSATFTYVLTTPTPPPVIDAITPDTVIVTGGTPVLVEGARFRTDGVLTLGGQVVAPTSVASGAIAFTAPPRSVTGTVVVRFAHPDGQSAAINLIYVAEPPPAAGTPPRITGIVPDACSTAGGTLVALAGSGFDFGGVGTLFVGDVEVTPTSRTSQRIEFTCPPAAAGGVTVRYANPGNAEASVPFRYVAAGPAATAPRITTIAPDSCPLAGGRTVVLEGADFDVGGTGALFVGAVAVTPTSRSAQRIEFTCPPAPAGGVSVRYVNPGNAEGSIPFRYADVAASGGSCTTTRDEALRQTIILCPDGSRTVIPDDAPAPACEVFAGSIDARNVADLAPLRGCREMTGDLAITIPGLTTLTATQFGLERLVRVRSLAIIDNDALTTISLPNLQTVDDLAINTNPVLTGIVLSGLQSTSTGECAITENESLSDCTIELLRSRGVACGSFANGGPPRVVQDGVCVAECASGNHLGGTAVCVPNGTCSTGFSLLPNGSCVPTAGFGDVCAGTGPACDTGLVCVPETEAASTGRCSVPCGQNNGGCGDVADAACVEVPGDLPTCGPRLTSVEVIAAGANRDCPADLPFFVLWRVLGQSAVDVVTMRTVSAFPSVAVVDFQFANTGASGGSDSCEFANDGFCDEPEFCDAGTDVTDCGRPPPAPLVGDIDQEFGLCFSNYSAVVSEDFTFRLVTVEGVPSNPVTTLLPPTVDECVQATSIPSFFLRTAANGGCGDPTRAACQNNPGDFPGCADVLECADNNGGCGDPTFFACIENVGAPPTCEDIDECADNNGGCGDPAFFACTNREAASPTCADINECTVGNGGCGDAALFACINNEGAPRTCAPLSCLVDNGGCGDPAFFACAENRDGPPTCSAIVPVASLPFSIPEDLLLDARGLGARACFEVTIDEPGSLIVDTTSQNCQTQDTFLTVHQGGSLIAANDDPVGTSSDLCAALTIEVQGGDFVVCVEEFGRNVELQDVQILIDFDDNNDRTSPAQITIPTTVALEIGRNDLVDCYRFDLTKQVNLTIRGGGACATSGGDFVINDDPQLDLSRIGEPAVTLAINDDSGVGVCPLLEMTLEPGSYQACVESFSAPFLGRGTITDSTLEFLLTP
jgi:hypothetical protein